jgi:HSP20 family protein
MNRPNEGSLLGMNPFALFDPFSRSSLLGPSISSLWNDPFRSVLGDMQPLIGQPSMGFTETDKAYEMNADLPGVRKEDVQVNVEGRKLTVSAKSQKKEDDAFGRRRWYGEYVRSMVLPDDAEMDKICAKYENGQLKVCIDKTQGKASGRQIEVK